MFLLFYVVPVEANDKFSADRCWRRDAHFWVSCQSCRRPLRWLATSTWTGRRPVAATAAWRAPDDDADEVRIGPRRRHRRPVAQSPGLVAGNTAAGSRCRPAGRSRSWGNWVGEDLLPPPLSSRRRRRRRRWKWRTAPCRSHTAWPGPAADRMGERRRKTGTSCR